MDEQQPNRDLPIRDLEVWGRGGPRVQLARGGRWASVVRHRVDLKAEVDPAPGEVRFYADPQDVERLRP